MQISIIIPCLNEARHIEATLEPLQALRRRGHEVMVCDGGSRDNTCQLAAPLADRLISTEPGRARQMNAGARAARHKILWFVHADTQVPANADQLITQGLQTSGRHWGRFNVRLSGRQPVFRLIERLINIRSCISRIATGDQGIFVYQSLFEGLGGYEDIPLMEDISLSKKLKKIGPPLCISRPLTTSSRRWEKHGVIPTVLLMWRLRLAYWLGTPADRLAKAYRNNEP